MSQSFQVRPVQRDDFGQWRSLWDGYNAFYGRAGASALPESVTRTTWERFLAPDEPIFALVAVHESSLIGIAHFLFHPSTTRIEPVCYLQDLFIEPRRRGQGAGRALISSAYDRARSAGATRVYWQTQASNATGRALYDRIAGHFGFIVYSHDIPRDP